MRARTLSRTQTVPPMTPDVVFQMIEQAKALEHRNRRLHDMLAHRIPDLHLSIGVRAPDPVTCLYRFIVEYIEMAPRLIECVAACAREARCEALFAPFIAAASGYFVRPSILLSQYEGLESLLIKAYQVHRLMEEMAENNRSISNSHLVDIEMTQANLLVHHLIGEPFANELDQAALVTICQIAGTPDYYELNLDPFVEQARHVAWSWMRGYWQHLLDRNGIAFNFPGLPSGF